MSTLDPFPGNLRHTGPGFQEALDNVERFLSMSTTDPQQPKAEPIDVAIDKFLADITHEQRQGMEFANLCWESKIASGELMVVRTTAAPETDGHNEWCGPYRTCSRCAVSFMMDDAPANYCPGCGAKIIE